MIVKAIERGVSEERIAPVLNLNVSSIRRKRNLLAGICPEAANLLRDRQCPCETFHHSRRALQRSPRRLHPSQPRDAARASRCSSHRGWRQMLPRNSSTVWAAR